MTFWVQKAYLKVKNVQIYLFWDWLILGHLNMIQVVEYKFRRHFDLNLKFNLVFCFELFLDEFKIRPT